MPELAKMDDGSTCRPGCTGCPLCSVEYAQMLGWSHAMSAAYNTAKTAALAELMGTRLPARAAAVGGSSATFRTSGHHGDACGCARCSRVRREVADALRELEHREREAAIARFAPPDVYGIPPAPAGTGTAYPEPPDVWGLTKR